MDSQDAPPPSQGLNYLAYYSQGFAADWPYTSYYGADSPCNQTLVSRVSASGKVRHLGLLSEMWLYGMAPPCSWTTWSSLFQGPVNHQLRSQSLILSTPLSSHQALSITNSDPKGGTYSAFSPNPNSESDLLAVRTMTRGSFPRLPTPYGTV